MLSDGDFDDDDSDTENVPDVDLIERLSKLQIGSQEEIDDTVSKASSKVLLRSNPVFDEKRISSKVFAEKKNSDALIEFLFVILVRENHRIHFRKIDR